MLSFFQRCFFFCAFPSFSTFYMRGWVQPLKLHDQEQIHSHWFLPKRHANPSDRQPGRFIVTNGLAMKETNRTQMSPMNRRNLLHFGTLGALLGPGLWNRSSQLPTVNRKLDANPSISCPFTLWATKAAGLWQPHSSDTEPTLGSWATTSSVSLPWWGNQTPPPAPTQSSPGTPGDFSASGRDNRGQDKTWYKLSMLVAAGTALSLKPRAPPGSS